MNGLETLLLAVALGMDAFSVALGVGLVASEPRQTFRLCWHFGFFQFLMPLVGWQGARLLSPGIGTLGKWVGAALLFFIGLRMILEAAAKRKDPSVGGAPDPTRGWSLVALSVATSIDALGVGFGFGLVRGDLFCACVVIGIVAAAMTWLGMRLGRVLGGRIGTFAEVLGGAVLVLLAARMSFF